MWSSWKDADFSEIRISENEFLSKVYSMPKPRLSCHSDGLRRRCDSSVKHVECAVVRQFLFLPVSVSVSILCFCPYLHIRLICVVSIVFLYLFLCLRVWACVCLFVCAYVYVRALNDNDLWEDGRGRECVCKFVYVFVCVSRSACGCTYVRADMHLLWHIHACTYICTYT